MFTLAIIVGSFTAILSTFGPYAKIEPSNPVNKYTVAVSATGLEPRTT